MGVTKSSSLLPFSSPSPVMGQLVSSQGLTHSVGTPRAAQAGLGGSCVPAVPMLDVWTMVGWGHPLAWQPDG